MKLSLREVCIKAVEAYGKIPRNEWVLQYPGQIVLAASQVHWTTEVTQVSRQPVSISDPYNPSIHFYTPANCVSGGGGGVYYFHPVCAPVRL